MILKIEILYSLFLGAFLTACLCYFIDFCIEKPSRIFGAYKVWLASIILNRYVPAWRFRLLRQYAKVSMNMEGLNRKENMQQWNKDERYRAQMAYKERAIELAATLAFWEKPLGMCIYCMNPYVCFATIWLTDIPNLVCAHWYLGWLFIAYPVLSNFMLRKMN